MLAAHRRHASAALVRRLLELGLDPARRDNDGRRAAEHAAAAGRWTMVAVLDPAYPLARRGRRCGRVRRRRSTAHRSRCCAMRLREGRFDDLHTVVGLLSPRELGAQLRDMPLAGPGAPANIASRIDWLLAQGADADVREGLEDNAMFALLAQGPVAASAVQALLRRAVSPAGSRRARALPRRLRRRAITRAAGSNNSRSNCSNAAPMPTRPRPPAIRRSRSRCAWAGCAWSNASSRRASIWTHAIRTA